ncbi:hypothetical protein AMATHDRAFT_48377 [Amanita thiersii Skay4041]|uniref:BTB domain-containing protein n=1 Tax=Amanita thiersii Skay4041 TaxID=703135 RepID=A0A2A9NGU3_9AGAR|nr:hypothetical protein AMATHDRAFT_48377 [Amanita thiersii Skay4041]
MTSNFSSPRRTSERFSDPTADIIFQSADGVKYYIHSKNLESTTGGFPPMEFASDKTGAVLLSERSKVLDLLFVFVYPERQPDLTKVPFDVLVPLAEAVEKYKVYPAMSMCKLRMTAAVVEYPLEVLSYGVKYSYKDVLDMAAMVAIQRPVDEVVSALIDTPSAASAWVQYYGMWLGALSKALNQWTWSQCRYKALYENCVAVVQKLGVRVGSWWEVDKLFRALPLVGNTSEVEWRVQADKIRRGMPKFSSFLVPETWWGGDSQRFEERWIVVNKGQA